MHYLLIVIALVANNLKAQNIDGYLIDALRYTSDDKIVNSRSAGLGFSYLGILNDQGSINYNPAGLTLISNSEITTGLNYNSNKLNSSYLQSKNSNSFNNLNITNFGVSSPVKTNYNSEEKYYLGISYSNSACYNRNIDINSFNPNKSYTYYESLDERSWTQDTRIGLDGFTFVNDSLFQDYKLTETGSLHEISLALASEFGKEFSFGGTMNISFGSFNYTRYLDETDILSKYQDTTDIPPYSDFDKVYHTLEYNHSFTSINFNLGMMYNPSDNFRISLNVLTPASLRVEEYFYEEAEVKYDDNSLYKYSNIGEDVTTIYDMSLPWSISLGASYNTDGLTLTSAFKFKDNSSLQYLETDDEYLFQLNQIIPLLLKSSYVIGVGIEYDVPNTVLQIRSGVTFTTSPIENFNSLDKLFSAGMSVFVIEQLRLDLFGQYFKRSNELYIYDNQKISLDNESVRIGLGLTYRY